MDQDTRRYVRRILALHVILLIVVVGVVTLGARQVYLTARLQAEEDTLTRQNLIARQTAAGLEDFFAGISENLNLLRRAEEEGRPVIPGRLRDRAPQAATDRAEVFALSSPMWLQLQDRTSGLIVMDTVTDRFLRVFPERFGRSAQIRGLIDRAAPQLEGIDEPRVTSPLRLPGTEETFSLVAVPAGSDQRYHLISLVRLAELRQRFLQPISADGAIGASLINDQGIILDAADPELKGMNFLSATKSGEVERLFAQARQGGAIFGSVVREPVSLGGETMPGAMITIYPVRVGDQVWSLAMTRDLAGVDSVVRETFGGTVLWALFVVVAMVAILLSTAVTAIRGRGKLERLRTEMLDRELQRVEEELDQARGIQLKWLPQADAEIAGIEIAAVNTPASHISGDFYNWFELGDGRVIIVIGDVTGHGMAAAFLMATTQLLVRTTMARPDIGGDVGKCMAEVNTQLCTQVYGGQFVTMLLCAIDTQAETIEIASAGHHAPLVCDLDGAGDNATGTRRYHELEIDAQLVLGVDDDLDFPTTVHDLSNDCRSMIIYTDGVIEAANDAGERYDLDKFVRDLPIDVDDPRALADGAVAAVDRFAGSVEHEDDLTLVAIRLPGRRPNDAAHPPMEAAAV
ncbi:MAG: SpoIIE family protein phosphatase [Planctomycetota bacterium]